MEVGYGFLCDYAQHAEGKVNALGIGFDEMWAESVPAIFSEFSLVVMLRPSSDSEYMREHPVSIVLRAPDEAEMVRLSSTVTFVPFGDQKVPSATVESRFGQLRLPQAGTYRVEVSLDEAEAPLWQTSFRLQYRSAPNQGEQLTA